MMALLILKSNIKNFYEKHYRVVRAILKFCVILIASFIITSKMNYSGFLGYYPLLFAVSLVCGVTPDIVSLLVLPTLVLGEIYQISPLFSVVLALLLIIYYLLFGRMTDKQGIILAAVPILSAIQLGWVVPIVAGLFFSPVMIPALVMGVLLHFVFESVKEYALAMSNVIEEVSPVASLEYLLDFVRGNLELVMVLIAFLFSYLTVYLIRRIRMQYASQIAILVGAILMLSVMLLGNIAFELELNLWVTIVSILVSVLIAYVVQFFRMTLDYQGTRKLQFEDDEYYYYVTAVPKFKVAVVDKTVTRILPEEEEENVDLKTELEKVLEEDGMDIFND